MVNGIWLICVGAAALIAVPPSSTKPLSGGAVIAIIFAFLVGPLSALWGLWGLVGSALNIAWFTKWPIYWLTWLFGAFAQATTGALLGLRAIQLIGDFKLPLVRGSLLVLGPLTIAHGIWSIVASFIFTVT